MAGLREGEVRIPSGCAIAAVISREGKKMTGESIMESMKPMHDRSNGLGGGFAGYGIYPEYKDYYALHLFFDCRDTRKACEALLKEGFEVVKDETRKNPDGSPMEVPMFINEEQVQGVGTVIRKNCQRSRWLKGQTFTWMGYSKEIKHTQGVSGLEFDNLLDPTR